jgi:hypothetical protein
MLFSLASAAFYPPRDDEGDIDFEMLLMQALMGSFTGVPYLGPVLKGMYDVSFGQKTFDVSLSPMFQILNTALDALTQLGKGVYEASEDGWTQDDLLEVMTLGGETAKKIGPLAGVPVKPVERVVENINKLRSDYEMDYDNYQKFLLIMGYGEYGVPQLKATGVRGSKKNWRKDIK